MSKPCLQCDWNYFTILSSISFFLSLVDLSLFLSLSSISPSLFLSLVDLSLSLSLSLPLDGPFYVMSQEEEKILSEVGGRRVSHSQNDFFIVVVHILHTILCIMISSLSLLVPDHVHRTMGWRKSSMSSTRRELGRKGWCVDEGVELERDEEEWKIIGRERERERDNRKREREDESKWNWCSIITVMSFVRKNMKELIMIT